MSSLVYPVDAERQLAGHYWILESAFPESELLSLRDLQEAMRAGKTLAWGIRGPEGAVGIAVVELYECGTALLAYLAVADSARGQGIGETLLAHVLSTVGSSQGFILAEIELPGSRPEEQRFGDPQRRARFYRRFGARALAITHYQPPVSVGLPYVRFCLIALPATAPVGDRINAADIVAFESEYHRADLGSPEVIASLASLDQGDWVQTVDLEALFG